MTAVIDSRALSLPPYSTVDSPLYTPTARECETILEQTPMAVATAFDEHLGQYEYTSKHLTLNLGPRLHGTTVPAYGLGGSVEGYVQVDKFDHVSRVVVTVQGHVQTTLAKNGVAFQNSASRSTLCILSKSQILWASGKDAPLDRKARLSFSIPIPATVKHGSRVLPPSFVALHPTVYGAVKYTISVELVRRAWKINDGVGTEFFYLPRSSPPPPKYQLPSCRARSLENLGIDSTKWKIIDLAPCRCSTAHLALPLPLTYVPRQDIPFVAVISAPNAIGDTLLVELLRQVNVTVMNRRSRSELILATAKFRNPVEEERDGRFVRTVKGELRGGRGAGEMSWIIDGLIEVSYAIRLTLTASDGKKFQHIEPVDLATHEWDPEDFDLDFPALGLVPRPRTRRSS